VGGWLLFPMRVSGTMARGRGNSIDDMDHISIDVCELCRMGGGRILSMGLIGKLSGLCGKSSKCCGIRMDGGATSMDYFSKNGSMRLP